IVERSDVVTATKYLARTYLANIEPNQHQQIKLPIAGPLAKYIVAYPLPYFGALVYLFPTMITSLYNEKISCPILKKCICHPRNCHGQ
ncbi:17023_t:CDS:2, partial [Gigaspora rosea]